MSIRIDDNIVVSNSHADIPATLAVAEARFSGFLGTNGYPEGVHWIGEGDVVVDTNGQYFVRERGPRAAQMAELRYLEGVAQNRGIALRAICASDAETFATIYVPTDDADAQNRLIGQGLKLSCPTSRQQASLVKNAVKWWLLWRRNGVRSKLLWV